MAGCFKAYDIRGKYPGEIDEALAYRAGFFLPSVLGGRRALIGRDARLSSPSLSRALAKGLLDAGCDVDDMGLASTPMVYFNTAEGGYDISVQVTASHNPKEDNGLKISSKGALPVGMESGLGRLESLVRSSAAAVPAAAAGRYAGVDGLAPFLSFLESRKPDLSGLKLAVDCSNGMGALTAKRLFTEPSTLFLSCEIDGSFPCHSPNPLSPEARENLAKAVLDAKADAGIIFDGDADRMMMVDEKGNFVRPDAIIALIARQYVKEGEPILQDIRTSRGVSEYLERIGAKSVLWKVGHAFAKVKLRELDSPFGGEYAGHYYFRDFHWCDSGELAALAAAGRIAEAKREGIPFSKLIEPISPYFNSGEINLRVGDAAKAVGAIEKELLAIEKPSRRLDFDGIRLDYPDWWISVRKSNTEPYLRIIAEATSEKLLKEKTDLVQAIAKSFASR